MKRAGRTDLLLTQRRNHEPIQIDGSSVSLRDQKPLIAGNMELTGGLTFPDFVKVLNARAFFWPGNNEGPIRSGTNHFRRYANEHPAILRCRFKSLLLENPFAEPLFCPYNSGAPRVVNGKKSPRGPNTFVKACDFSRTGGKVVEVTFVGEIKLPPDTEVGEALKESWRSFF
jgi:hypothetical protein